MIDITLNGERRTFADQLTVAQLVERLGFDRRRIAVEVNHELVPGMKHVNHRLTTGDAVEIVTLVGGGSSGSAERGERSAMREEDSRSALRASRFPEDKPLVICKFAFQSRLITGTGKYA